MRGKELLSITISSLAFIISSLSFYLTVIRSEEPQIRVGSPVYIFHDVYGAASVAMPVNISNSGARLATVERFAVVVRPSGSMEGYLLRSSAFQKINEKGEFQDDSMASPVTISRGSEITKQILFVAAHDQEDTFSLVSPGRYELMLLAWLPGRQSPNITDKFEISIEQMEANRLAHWRSLQVTNSVSVEQLRWEDWRAGPIKDIQAFINGRGE